MGFLVGLVAPDPSRARRRDSGILAVNPLGVVVSWPAISDELRSATRDILCVVVDGLDGKDIIE
eukprot:6779935-Pyramimonas_sp.AAC.1